MRFAARFCAALPALPALALLASCAAPDGRLHLLRDSAAAPHSRKPLATQGESGALPPPSAVFEKARSSDAEERAQGRAQLQAARARAGLGAGAERISFLDLPSEVAFATLKGAAVAAPRIAGVDGAAAAAMRVGFLDALGGAAPRERAYLADERFLAVGQAARLANNRARLSLRVFDAAGAPAGTVAVDGAVGAAKTWLALGRRAAEKFLALPRVAAAMAGRSGRGFAAPGAKREGYPTATIATNAVAVVAVEGARGGGAALMAALRAALKARGMEPSRSAYAPRRISARVTIRRVGAKDRAEIRWLFTEQDPQNQGGSSERLIGEVKQARTGARGAFDGPWGPIAVEAANAAADAFLKLSEPPKKR